MNGKKEKFIISIESGLCVDGDRIAKELGRILGIKSFSGEIIKEASRLSAIPENLLLRYEDKAVREAYDLMAEDEAHIRLPSARRFIMAQLAACKSLAEQGSCILVNHHSNAAMSDHNNHIRIFVHTGPHRRIKAYDKETHMDIEFAASELRRESKARTRYFKSISKRWGEAANYDFCLDSTNMAPSQAAASIVRYLETAVHGDLVPRPTRALRRGA